MSKGKWRHVPFDRCHLMCNHWHLHKDKCPLTFDVCPLAHCILPIVIWSLTKDQSSKNQGQMSKGSHKWSLGKGRWSMVNGQCQHLVVNGQLATGAGKCHMSDGKINKRVIAGKNKLRRIVLIEWMSARSIDDLVQIKVPTIQRASRRKHFTSNRYWHHVRCSTTGQIQRCW